MYKCEDCGGIFDEPRRINADDYYGVSDLFESRSKTIIKCCPYCDGDYEELSELEEQEEETNE